MNKIRESEFVHDEESPRKFFESNPRLKILNTRVSDFLKSYSSTEEHRKQFFKQVSSEIVLKDDKAYCL
jgi:UDP-N-acetylmuramate-alanine ligase